jgi:PAS domain S-box-containing protein
MSIFQFYLTEMGFVSVILIIVSLVITLYLMRGKERSRSGRLLLTFFGSIIANGVTMLIANAWIPWGSMLMPAQDAWILLGGIALALYAYQYPQFDQKQEAKLILVFTSGVAIFAAGYSIYYAIQFVVSYPPGIDESQAYYLLLPLMTFFIVAVFLRRAVHYVPSPASIQKGGALRLKQLTGAILHPEKREVRTLRDYALALSLGLLPGLAFLLKPLPFLPAWLPSYMLSIGSVLAVSALALVYINNSGEQTSFIGKIMGISLVTFLLIFGAFGSSIIHRSKNLPDLYNISLSPFDKIIQTHELVVYLIFWVILSSLIIIILFPVFYRLNLVRPLENLLGGVKLANRGELDIQVPVQYEDEIGYLTHSFNDLAASLHQSIRTRDLAESELQQRIEELHQSEEKFYKAFHSSPVVMVLQNQQDRTYLDVNAAFTEITGYSREEAIGQRPGELNLYPTQEEANRVAQAMVEADGRLRNFEFNFRQKSGQVRTGLLSTEYFDVQGVRTLLGIVMDISERKRAEDKIRLLNVEMERRVAERSWQLSTLLDLAFLVSHRESPNHILIPALERLLEIGSLQVVCVYTYASDKQYLRLEAQVGLNEHEAEMMNLLLPTGVFAAWLVQPKDALLFSDLEANKFLPESMHPGRLHSCLVTQLVARGEVLGMMSCYRQDVHTFSLEEVSLLVAVAEQLGISLENQRLRQEAEKVAITTERQRLARDLHDSITQSLYGLTLFTRSSQDALRAGDQEKLAASLEQIEENVLIALREMRLLLFQMQPQGLEGGFYNQINTRLDLVERRLGIQATCQIDDTILLSPEVEGTLFRVALEALNNSLKHSQASLVHISLEQVKGTLVLEVSDDGRGFAYAGPSEPPSFAGMGLNNMYSRAAELGGNLEIASSPGFGTRVRLLIDPLADQAKRSTT